MEEKNVYVKMIKLKVKEEIRQLSSDGFDERYIINTVIGEQERACYFLTTCFHDVINKGGFENWFKYNYHKRYLDEIYKYVNLAANLDIKTFKIVLFILDKIKEAKELAEAKYGKTYTYEQFTSLLSVSSDILNAKYQACKFLAENIDDAIEKYLYTFEQNNILEVTP